MIDVGSKINNWTYLGKSLNGKKGYGHFKCECGEEKDSLVSNIVTGKSKSCGHCKWNVLGITKQDYQHLVFIRTRMIRRCYYEKDTSYKHYSSRGITVCNEWLESSDKFVRWAIANGWKSGLSLDRIDNGKGYSPSNCRWATPKQQANNRSTNICFSHDGETKTMAEWCDEFGIPWYLAYNRWARGERNFNELFANVDKRRKFCAGC